MDISILDQIRKARNDVMGSPEGNAGNVVLPLTHVDALLKALAESEREARETKDTLEALRSEVKEVVEAFSCSVFAEETPSPEDDEDLFEVFVGTSVDDCGRMFAYWNSKDEEFYILREGEAGANIYDAVEGVLFWRVCLPEPDEVIDISGLE